MQTWLESNLWTRAMRDHVNETVRLQATSQERVKDLDTVEFLSLVDRKADQQKQLAVQAEAAGWR